MRLLKTVVLLIVCGLQHELRALKAYDDYSTITARPVIISASETVQLSLCFNMAKFIFELRKELEELAHRCML